MDQLSNPSTSSGQVPSTESGQGPSTDPGQDPSTDSGQGPFPPAGGSDQGNGIVPPPPQAPEIKLRTMESDIASVQQSGGNEPQPQFINPPTFPQDIRVGGGVNPLPTDDDSVKELSSSGGKRAFLWLILLIVLIGVGWIVYHYVAPLLLVTIQERASPSAVPLTNAPSENLAPNPQIVQPIEQPPSIFGASFESIPKATINDYTLVSLIAALQNESNKKPETGNFKEVALVDTEGVPLTFNRYISVLLPEARGNGLEDALTTIFEDSFSAYLYYDDAGVWPGYVAKIKSGADIDIVTLADRIQKLETSSYANFFITPPGDSSGFRTGQIKNTYVDRFTSFTQPGASFNYGIFNQYLIINTSYGGLLKALELLGL